jgi:hypothetical protein
MAKWLGSAALAAEKKKTAAQGKEIFIRRGSAENGEANYDGKEEARYRYLRENSLYHFVRQLQQIHAQL